MDKPVIPVVLSVRFFKFLYPIISKEGAPAL